MICDNCQAEIEQGRKFCGRCGAASRANLVPPPTAAAKLRHCQACGHEVPEAKKFCGACGRPLEEQIQTPRPARTPAAIARSPSTASVRLGPVATPGGPAGVPLNTKPTSPDQPPARNGGMEETSPSGKPGSGKRVGLAFAVIVLAAAAGVWFGWGGKLEVVSDPAGAEVVLDGKLVGRTRNDGGSLIVPYLVHGTHTLRVTHPGFDDWSQSVSLGYFELSHPVRATLSVPSFALTVVTNPAGANVQVDGHDGGTSDAAGRLVVEKVSRGQHVITVLLAGYPGRSSTVWVGGPLSVQVDLAGAASPAEGGGSEIASPPGNVQVQTPFGTVESTTDPNQASRNVGVDSYPGAAVVRGSAANMTFGGTHTASVDFETTDPPSAVRDFYKSKFPTANVMCSQADRCTIMSGDRTNMTTINILLENGKTRLHIARVTKAANSGSPAEVNQWLSKAEDQFQQGDYRGAIQSCDSALSLDPTNAKARQLKAKVEDTMKILGK
jgi:Double zinc ribbon/PEGA domain